MSNTEAGVRKCALVTGASSGIGHAIALALIEAGYEVTGIARDFSKADILISSGHFNALSCDLTDIPALIHHIEALKKAYSFDLLVNNAGAGYFGPHECLSPAAIHEMACTNIEVPMLLCNMLLRDLKQNKGTIINVSSVTAKKTNTHGCAYGATKAALTSFSNSLFDEARKHGVRVTAIHPDMTSSNFYRNADFCEEPDYEYSLTPSEVAAAVMYAINARDGMVISDITLKPQKHRIVRKKL